jgi:MATE family multidrug resistance protein
MQNQSWKYHFLQTILLALPVCLSNVGHITVDLADNYFVGQLPERTIGQAAISLAGSFYVLVLVLSIGVSYSLTPIVAELNAKNDKASIAVHLRHSLIINLITTAGLFAILFFSSGVLRYTGKDPAVVELAISFLNVIMLSMIPLSVFFTFKQFTEGMSDTRTAMVITIGANLLNIFLNYLLVFGKLGFPQMGVMGSCWATFISRTLMAVSMFAYVRFGKKYSGYRVNLFSGKTDKAIFKSHLKIGIPSALMFGLEVAAFSIPTLFIPGSAQLAAHRLALSLAAMTYMVSSGLGAAATIRVGHYVGMGDKPAIRRAGFSAILLSIGFMLFSAFLFVVFRNELPAIFNTEKEVLKYASLLLVIGAAFQLFDGTQVTAQGALRGLKDTVYPGWVAFIAYWLIGLPISWILCVPLEMGATGVWYGFVAGLLVAAGGFILRYNKLTKSI